MTSMKTILAVAAAVAMVGTPVIASANPASKLSIAQTSSAQTSSGQANKARAGTNTKQASELGGSIALAVLAAAAVIGGILLATTGGSDSP